MQLTCETKKLNVALQAAFKIIKKENFLRLIAQNDILKVETAENPQYVSAEIPAMIKEPGEYTVNAQLFTNLIGKIEDETIIIDTDKNKEGKDKLVQITYNLEKSKPTTAKLPIASDQIQSIPLIVPEKEITISKENLDTIIKKVIFASSKEPENKLSSIQLIFKNNVLCANATNTHVIAQKLIKCETGDDFNVVVPVNTFNQLLAVKSEKDTMVKIAIQKNMIQFTIDNIKFVNNVIQYNYPNVNRVIASEKDRDISITFNKEETIKTIQRLNLFNQKEDPLVLLIENSQLSFHTKTENGALKEIIECKNNNNTENSRLGLNTGYLLNILSNIEADEVNMSWKSKDTRTVLFVDAKDKNVRYITSPVRLHNAA